MKKLTGKIDKIIKLVTGSLLLAAFMIVNVQIGLNESEAMDLDFLNLNANIHTPTAVASGGWANVHCGPDVNDMCDGNGSLTCCK